MPKVYFSLPSQKMIALIGEKNIRTRVTTNGPMFSLLVSRGLVLQVVLNVFTFGGCQKHEIIHRTLWDVSVLVVEV